MPTISDVANLAGLSRTTVSRVINNHPYVTKEKRKLVLDAMEKLGYFPNTTAQNLRMQKTDTIAVLVPKLINPFFAYLVESIEEYATQNDLQILMCNTKYNQQRELEYLHLLQSKQVDGIIMASIENNWDKIEPFVKYGPIILCNDYTEGVTVPSIRLNQFQGGYIGTTHLIDQGYKKIGYCYRGSRGGLSNDRFTGFKKALSDKQIIFNEKWLFKQAIGIEDGKRIMHEIAEMKDRPQALFTGSDEVAAGIVSEAKKLHFRVPEDIAVIGFDDQPIASLMETTLTTIRQPIEKMGQKTMEVMIETLSSRNTHLRAINYELPLELVKRNST